MAKHALSPLVRRVFVWMAGWIQEFRVASPRQKLYKSKWIIGIVAFIFFVKTFGSLFAPPKIMVSFPGEGGESIPLDEKIELQFDRAMQKNSVQKHFSITPEVAGEFSWEGNSRLIFTPKEQLKRGQTYTVEIGPFAQSSYYVPMFVFKKISFSTIGHPKVVLASPQAEAPKDKFSVMVMFDRPMIPVTTDDKKQQQLPAFTFSPPLKGEGRWLGTSAYQFFPSEKPTPATTYTYTVKAGMKSEDGGETQQDQTFSFSTELPRVLGSSPNYNEQYANPVASVSATFNLPMDQKSAEEHFQLFELSEGDTKSTPLDQKKRVSAKVRMVGNTVGLYPEKPLQRGVPYGAEITEGIKSKFGQNGMSTRYYWEFRVADFPKVIRSTPEHNDTDVGEDHSLSVSFNVPMDENSFKNNLTITPAPERKPYTYFSSYKGSNTLNISTYIGRSQTYAVTIGKNARDQYGVPLGRDYTFSFKTAPYDPSVSIQPSGTYFALFNQPVVPRVVSKVVNAGEVNYDLYQISEKGFLELSRLRTDWQNPSRDWQQLNPHTIEGTKYLRSWKETFEQAQNVPVHVITKVSQADGSNLPPGLYFIDAKLPSGEHDNMVMIIGKAVLTLKVSEKQVLVWAVDQSTGQVVPDMDIRFTREDGKPFLQGKTNQDGVFIADEPSLLKNDKPFYVLGKKGDDIAVVSYGWNEGIQPYDFDTKYYYDYHEQDSYKAEKQLKIHVMVDRPIYRPGQTVYFKGVVRDDDDGLYSMIDAKEITIEISDNRGKVLSTQQLPLNSYGTFSGSFGLSEEGSVGNYNITAKLNGNAFNQSFQVEEYVAPEFEVQVSSDKPEYIKGEQAELKIASHFYFGAPMDFAPLKWTALVQNFAYRWDKDLGFEFGEPETDDYSPWWYGDWDNSYYGGKELAEGTGKTNIDGAYSVKLPLSGKEFSSPKRVYVEGVVEDESNKAIANTQSFVVFMASKLVGLKPESYSNEVGKEARVEAVTLGVDGKELPNTPVSVSIYKHTWNYVRELNPDDGEYYWKNKSTDELVSTQDVTSNEYGRQMIVFVPKDAGTYKVAAQVSDEKGNVSKSSTFVWVSGWGNNVRRENNDRILLIPDKQEYKVGEHATFQAVYPYDTGVGLITEERAQIFDYQLANLTSENQRFTVPVKDRYAPNVYVSALFVKPGSEVKNPPQLKMGVAEIRVNDPKHKLKISAETDKTQYQPGDEMTVKFDIRDGNGDPVQTELAVALVDQAVWAVAKTQLANIYETFYNPRNWKVQTSHSLTESMDRINANVNLGSKGGSGGGCFTGDTLILMADGSSKPIDQISVGDEVLTRESEDSSALVPGTVKKLFVHDVDGYVLLNNSLKVTGVHRIFTKNGWKRVSEMKIGDEILDKDGNWSHVLSLKPVSGPVRVYNIEISTYHTYFAGGVWVHNQKDGGEEVRDEFKDTAYWNAHLETDKNGHAEVKISLPDNTTTWRLVGVGVTKDTGVGDTVEKVIVTKNALIRPMLPRFLSVGDEPILGMIIHNQTENPQDITASIQAENLFIEESSTKTATIPPFSSVPVKWKTVVKHANDVTELKIRLNATGSGGFEDSVEKTLPVVSYYTPETVATSGEAKDAAQEKLNIPENIVPNMGELSVELYSSLGGGVQNVSKYFTSYAYWCNEQTTSKILAMSYLYMIADQAKLDHVGPLSKAYIKEYVSDGVQRLVKAQLPDGGWGWWSESGFYSSPEISTLVMEGLISAKNNGFDIPHETLKDGVKYLQNQLSYKENTLDRQAFMASVLTMKNANGTVDQGTISTLVERRWQMSLTGRIYLLRAMQNANANPRDRQRLFEELMAYVKKTSTTAHWEDKTSAFYNGNVTVTSVMLEALVHQNTNHPLIPEVTRWLMDVQEDNHWSTTRDTAAAVKALSSMMEKRGETKSNYSWMLQFGGKKQAEGKFTAKELLATQMNTFSLADLPKNQEIPVDIQKSGKGSLYYNMNLRYFLPFTKVEPKERGIAIYRDLIDGSGKVLSKEKITEGEEVWVRLTIAVPAQRNNVVIEDKLPAGFEAVNESLATSSILNAEYVDTVENEHTDDSIEDYEGSNTKPQTLYFSRQEFRDDRVALFAEYVPAGIYEYKYRVRPMVPGKYHYVPVEAYDMYRPDIFGRSEGGWLDIEEKK